MYQNSYGITRILKHQKEVHGYYPDNWTRDDVREQIRTGTVRCDYVDSGYTKQTRDRVITEADTNRTVADAGRLWIERNSNLKVEDPKDFDISSLGAATSKTWSDLNALSKLDCVKVYQSMTGHTKPKLCMTQSMTDKENAAKFTQMIYGVNPHRTSDEKELTSREKKYDEGDRYQIPGENDETKEEDLKEDKLHEEKLASIYRTCFWSGETVTLGEHLLHGRCDDDGFERIDDVYKQTKPVFIKNKYFRSFCLSELNTKTSRNGSFGYSNFVGERATSLFEDKVYEAKGEAKHVIVLRAKELAEEENEKKKVEEKGAEQEETVQDEAEEEEVVTPTKRKKKKVNLLGLLVGGAGVFLYVWVAFEEFKVDIDWPWEGDEGRR